MRPTYKADFARTRHMAYLRTYEMLNLISAKWSECRECGNSTRVIDIVAGLCEICGRQIESETIKCYNCLPCKQTREFIRQSSITLVGYGKESDTYVTYYKCGKCQMYFPVQKASYHQSDVIIENFLREHIRICRLISDTPTLF